VTNPSISTLCDKFDQGSINTNLWTNPSYSPDTGNSIGIASAGTAAISGTSTLQLSPHYSGLGVGIATTLNIPSVICGNNQGIESVIPYDLTDGGLSVELASLTPAANYTVSFALDSGSPSHNYLRWHTTQSGATTTLYATNNSGGDLASFTYSAITFRFLRIRESSGIVYWDYSADGISWSNAASASDPFSVTNLYVNLYGVYTSGSGAGSVSWANVDYVL
jgi:hypothetical protein